MCGRVSVWESECVGERVRVCGRESVSVGESVCVRESVCGSECEGE